MISLELYFVLLLNIQNYPFVGGPIRAISSSMVKAGAVFTLQLRHVILSYFFHVVLFWGFAFFLTRFFFHIVEQIEANERFLWIRKLQKYLFHYGIKLGLSMRMTHICQQILVIYVL